MKIILIPSNYDNNLVYGSCLAAGFQTSGLLFDFFQKVNNYILSILLWYFPSFTKQNVKLNHYTSGVVSDMEENVGKQGICLFKTFFKIMSDLDLRNFIWHYFQIIVNLNTQTFDFIVIGEKKCHIASNYSLQWLFTMNGQIISDVCFHSMHAFSMKILMLQSTLTNIETLETTTHPCYAQTNNLIPICLFPSHY